MRREREDLPASTAGSDQDLKPEFTYNELLAELDAEFMPPPDYKHGDVTVDEFMTRYKKSKSRAYEIMREKARLSNGRLLYMSVMMPNGINTMVLRKAT